MNPPITLLSPLDAKWLAALQSTFGTAYMGYFGPTWAAKWGGSLVPRYGGMRALKQYVVHHEGAPKTTLEGVWRYHVRNRGYNTIGYHLGIYPGGEVQVAALPSHRTNGAGPENNDKSLYVVCLGNYEVDQPPATMLDALYRVLCVCDDVLGGRIWRGHKEVKPPGYTQCPGQLLMPSLELMRGPLYGAAVPRPQHYP